MTSSCSKNTAPPPAAPALPPVAPPAPSAADAALVDEIARAAFSYFIRETDPRTGLTRDQARASWCSSAACGFALSALAYGAERGWIARTAAVQRVQLTLSTFQNPALQRNGLFPHFLTMEGQPVRDGETGISTIDSALLLMGVLTAGEYFGGALATQANAMISNANWRAFLSPDHAAPLVSMLWAPAVPGELSGTGALVKCLWSDYTDETMVINVLACGTPNAAHRLPGSAFYAWNRPRVEYPPGNNFIRSYPNTLFTYAFAHLWLDVRQFGVDTHGVDWWSNSYRACVANRTFCLAHADRFCTFATNRWGVSPCYDGDNYLVPQPMPNGLKRDWDINGTVAPYAAGMALMFMPEHALAALREMRTLVLNGTPLWCAPADGGYGLWDSFNMDGTPPRVTKTVVGIDQGPLLMACANYRDQFFWRLLRSNAMVRSAFAAFGFHHVR
ncbi:MAG: DUF3131 domain-containing protein [bacterium]|nr:DUF3131 domain-containing protein [bacterium]